MRVEVAFDDSTEGVSLPLFRPMPRDGFSCGVEADLAVRAVAEWFGDRRAAAAQRNGGFAFRNRYRIAVGVGEIDGSVTK